jgi:hypothetical protein
MNENTLRVALVAIAAVLIIHDHEFIGVLLAPHWEHFNDPDPSPPARTAG